MREHTFEIPGEARLNVSIPAGEIDVETQPGPEAFVRLSPIVDDEESREVVERAVVELHGNELVVKVKDKHLRFGSTPEIRAEIKCPDGTRARLHTASANVRARGTLGDTEAHVASGDVEIERVEGRLEAHSASGDLEIGAVRDAAKVHSASGDVGLGRTDGPVTVRSASGDVAVARRRRGSGRHPLRVRRRPHRRSCGQARRGRRSYGQRRSPLGHPARRVAGARTPTLRSSRSRSTV